jgi:hypothetical protein
MTATWLISPRSRESAKCYTCRGSHGGQVRSKGLRTVQDTSTCCTCRGSHGDQGAKQGAAHGPGHQHVLHMQRQPWRSTLEARARARPAWCAARRCGSRAARTRRAASQSRPPGCPGGTSAPPPCAAASATNSPENTPLRKQALHAAARHAFYLLPEGQKRRCMTALAVCSMCSA